MKRLKTIARILMVCLGMFFTFGVAAQQRTRPQGEQQGGQQMTMQERNAQMLKQYKEELNLTDEQVTKLEAIYARTMEQQQALRNQNASREEMMKKRRELMAKNEEEVKAILTEEQVKKFEAMLAQRQQGMQRGQGQRQRSSSN